MGAFYIVRPGKLLLSVDLHVRIVMPDSLQPITVTSCLSVTLLGEQE